MVWLEVINVRSAGIVEAGKILDLCRQIIESLAFETALRLKVFCNANYATDISIQLQWKSDPGGASILGTEISSACQGLGLISHTVWFEQEGLTVDTPEMSAAKKAAEREGNGKYVAWSSGIR